jgi:hypothetical protein
MPITVNTCRLRPPTFALVNSTALLGPPLLAIRHATLADTLERPANFRRRTAFPAPIMGTSAPTGQASTRGLGAIDELQVHLNAGYDTIYRCSFTKRGQAGRDMHRWHGKCFQ